MLHNDVKRKLARLFELGYRVVKTGNENAVFYTVTTPNGKMLKFEDRFDEVTGVDKKSLGFRLTEGDLRNLPGGYWTAERLEELRSLFEISYYSVKQFLNDLSALKTGRAIIEDIRSWIKKSYNDVEYQIIMASPATDETLLIVLLAVDNKVESLLLNKDTKEAYIAVAKQKIPGLVNISI